MIQITIFSFFSLFLQTKWTKMYIYRYIEKHEVRVDVDIDLITSISFSLKNIYIRYTANEWAQSKHKKRK